MEIVRTPRTWMREFDVADAADFFALNADPEVMRYTGDKPFRNVGEAEELVRGYHCYRTDGFGRWTLIRSEDDALLGWCGLRRQPDGTVDLGYRLHRRFWGMGYATEAAIACVGYGFGTLGLESIIGRTARANAASIRVLEKCDMRFWKAAPCETIEDSLFYRIDRP